MSIRSSLQRLAQLHLRSYHPKYLTDAVNDIRRSAEKMNIKLGGTVPLPTDKMKFSVNRSPFVHSKSKLQFQKDTHKRLIEIYGDSTTGQDATNVVHFLRYLEHTILVLHPGCSARVKLYSSEKLDVDAAPEQHQR
jgi:small subunit ribosomal protein S10